MGRISFLMATCALLVACGEGDGTNPFSGDTETNEESTDSTNTGEVEVSAAIRGDLDAIYYNALQNTVVVEGLTLDEEPFNTLYTRRADQDANYNGYHVYMAQDDPLDRHTTALVLQSGGTTFEGVVRAGIAVTGGVRNRIFGGGYFERDGDYEPVPTGPDEGLVTYAGKYAGLTNIGLYDYTILQVPDAGTPNELRTTRAAQTTGDIFINVDFNDMEVEGNVYNRRLEHNGLALPSIVLIATELGDDGVFNGASIEYEGVINKDIGDYAGILGGPESRALGGSLKLDEWDGEGDPLGYENELEWGVFVLERCGTQHSNESVCSQVDK
ncbi:hypothetical protein [Mesobacterium pallidum]|uniref:hypothetical protein n=1 Tax=Mesobacterium pallidum TaxID=2872037 RepID=UPI001EE24C78|nr:hypothetical protein [Mesobacterium pallidum]